MFVFLTAGITWGKVVSLYAVAGALAVDCVRHGHPTSIHILVDSLGQFVRKFLVPWLKRRGGWVSVISELNNGPHVYIYFLVISVWIMLLFD